MFVCLVFFFVVVGLYVDPIYSSVKHLLLILILLSFHVPSSLKFRRRRKSGHLIFHHLQ